jgi:hypothetical protein
MSINFIIIFILITIIIGRGIDFCSFNGMSRNLESKKQCLLTGVECCVVEWIDNTQNYYLCFNQTEVKINNKEEDILLSYKNYFLSNLFSNKQTELISRMNVLCNSTTIPLLKNDL